MRHTKREYTIMISWGSTQIEILHPTITDIENNRDGEVYFSLQEQFDKVLDLNFGESMYFQPNRDDKNSKAIIVRLR